MTSQARTYIENIYQDNHTAVVHAVVSAHKQGSLPPLVLQEMLEIATRELCNRVVDAVRKHVLSPTPPVTPQAKTVFPKGQRTISAMPPLPPSQVGKTVWTMRVPHLNKRLGDCTKGDLLEVAKAANILGRGHLQQAKRYKALADKVPDGSTVKQAVPEADAKRILKA